MDLLNEEHSLSKENEKYDACHALQDIYIALKEDYNSSLKILERVKASADYTHVISNLYSWSKENKMMNTLIDFYIASVKSYKIDLKDFTVFIAKAYEKLKTNDVAKFNILLRNTAEAIGLDNEIGFETVCKFIVDYRDFEPVISEGFKQNSTLNNKIVKLLVDSGNIPCEIVGSKCYSSLASPDFNICHLITHTSDSVLLEVIRNINGNGHNSTLLDLIFKRAVLDELAAEAIKKLAISDISEKDLQRIYSMFHLNPLNYIKYEIYKFGFDLNEDVVVDLIRELGNVYSDDLFGKITAILSKFDMTEKCYGQMISSLDPANYNFKRWALKTIRTDGILLPFFIKLCWFVHNEEDLETVRSAILVLQSGKKYDIIEKWAKMKKFERLTRRVYPLVMTDPVFYKRVYDSCPTVEEKRMLNDVYDLAY